MDYENIKYRDKGLILIGVGLMLSLLLLILRLIPSSLGFGTVIIIIFGLSGPFIVVPIGLGFLYLSLLDRYRGLFILLIGAFFYTLSLILIFVIPFQFDSFVVILLLDTFFFSTTFFIPGLIKLVKDVRFEEIYILTYSVLPLTILGVLIYAVIVAVVFPLDFINNFNDGLILALPISLFIAHVIFCLLGAELDTL
jgi:hypothetical protein